MGDGLMVTIGPIRRERSQTNNVTHPVNAFIANLKAWFVGAVYLISLEDLLKILRENLVPVLRNKVMSKACLFVYPLVSRVRQQAMKILQQPKKILKKMILDNRRIIIREVADNVGISFGSWQAIFTHVVGMKRAAAKNVPKLLNFKQIPWTSLRRC